MNHSTVLPTEKEAYTDLTAVFQPNPIAKAMGFTTPLLLPVDDFTAQCAMLDSQQRDQLLTLLDMMVSFHHGVSL